MSLATIVAAYCARVAGSSLPPSAAALASSAAFADRAGKMPLHYAAEYNSCEPEVFTAVLEAHPEAARHKNKWGQLPIHYATWRRAPPEIIRQLHEAYPEGAELTDTLAGFSAEQTILNTSLKGGEAEAATAS